MLKFVLICDTEGLISLNQVNPTWSRYQILKGLINRLIKDFRYNKNGFEELYKETVRSKFPISFLLVGKLFKPIENSPSFIDWGYHTYSHLPLTLINNKKLKEELKNIYHCKSFNAPIWMVEDESNPNRIFNELEKQGYKKIVYLGKMVNLRHQVRMGVFKKEKRGKLDLITVSNSFEGNSSKKHMIKIMKDIQNNLSKDGIYCLTTHDFTHKNSNNLRRIIHFTRDLEKQGLLNITNLRDV